jgi:hypothetical protein
VYAEKSTVLNFQQAPDFVNTQFSSASYFRRRVMSPFTVLTLMTLPPRPIV